MVVLIELFGAQRDKAKKDKVSMPITEKTVVRDVLEYLRKLFPDLPLDENLVLTTVNHELVSLDKPLKSNDTVSILPHIGGG